MEDNNSNLTQVLEKLQKIGTPNTDSCITSWIDSITDPGYRLIDSLILSLAESKNDNKHAKTIFQSLK